MSGKTRHDDAQERIGLPMLNLNSLELQLADRVLNLQEAAALTGLSPDTLKRCHKRKEITLVRLSPRRVGVRLRDLRTFIDSRAA